MKISMRFLPLFFSMLLCTLTIAQKHIFSPVELGRFGDGEYYTSIEKDGIEALKSVSSATSFFLPTQSGQVEVTLFPSEVKSRDFQVKTVRNKIFGSGFKESDKTDSFKDGTYLEGHVKGDGNTFVSIQIHGNTLTSLLVDSDGSLYNIIREKGEVYTVKKNYHDSPIKCGDDKGHLDSFNENPFSLSIERQNSEVCKKVQISFHADYDFYKKKGNSVQQVSEYIMNVFANEKLMYQRDGIEVEISEIKVWTNPDPFLSARNSGEALGFFRTYIEQNDFKGDVAHLVSPLGANFGGVAYVGVLCLSGNNRKYQIAYSNWKLTYKEFPNYSWDVMVATHENGHNFGSPHTQACKWNGNNTAIDGCYNPEGSCVRGPIPSDGGTVMSYCHITSVGINLQKGFGEQPAALIRQRIAAASCLKSCDEGDDEEERDLTISKAIVSITDDGFVTVQTTIQNKGKAVENVGVVFRLSTKKNYYSNRAYKFGSTAVSISDNSTYLFQLRQPIANIELSDGTYYMSVFVDEDQDIKETEENNNLYYVSNPIELSRKKAYCELSKEPNPNYEWISSVAFDGYLRESSNKQGGYSLTKTAAKFKNGQKVKYAVGIDFLSPSKPNDVYISAWLDMNKDGQFTESEKVFSGKTKDKVSGIFEVKSTAVGVTRLRIKMGYQERDVVDPCEGHSYGETEDYELEIIEDVRNAPEWATECREYDTSVALDFVDEPFPEVFENGGWYEIQLKKSTEDWEDSKTFSVYDDSMIIFENLEPENSYHARVRSKLNTYSPWSKTASFETRILCKDLEVID